VDQLPAAREWPGVYLKSIADAAAVGGRWIITLEDELRARLLRQEGQALEVWRGMGALTAFFAAHSDWVKLAPFGTVGIVFDTTGKNLSNSEEFLNLVARRQISYRVIDRSRLSAGSLAGLRAVLAFDLAPPSEPERKVLHDFAAQGGLVLAGPSWGKPPKDQSYTIDSVEQGEVAIYKDEAPDPQSVARDLNDLVDAADLGVTLTNAPSVLPYVTASDSGDRMVMQLVNYTDAPVESLVIWLQRKIKSARLHVPNGPALDLPVRRSGARTEITIPKLGTYGAVVVE